MKYDTEKMRSNRQKSIDNRRSERKSNDIARKQARAAKYASRNVAVGR